MKTIIFLAALFAGYALNQNLFTQTKCEKCKCETCTETCCKDGKCSGEAECCKEKKCCEQDVSTVVKPSDKCIVAGETIEEGKAVEFEYLGVTYKFCCEGCLEKFKKEPANYIKTKLMCPVMPEDEIDRDTFVLHEGVKYYFCCPSCIKKFERNPEKYLKPSKN